MGKDIAQPIETSFFSRDQCAVAVLAQFILIALLAQPLLNARQAFSRLVLRGRFHTMMKRADAAGPDIFTERTRIATHLGCIANMANGGGPDNNRKRGGE